MPSCSWNVESKQRSQSTLRCVNGDFETVEKIVTAEKARIEKAREKRITARVRGVRVEDDPFVEIGGSSITERTTGIQTEIGGMD